MDIESTDGEYRYKIGLIDFFTKYTTAKALENIAKRTVNQVEADKVSAWDHENYQKRFVEFMRKNL